MANYKQVGYGSQGSDVKTLQKMLNSYGYKLDEDGIFGAKTQAAVKDYQKKNNLAVDGIVGTNTWGALTKTGTTNTNNNTGFSYSDFQVSSATSAADKNRQNIASQKPGEFSYQAYEASDVVKQAQALLQQQIANKPGAYQSQWQTQLDETMDKILNREKFSYDLNGDALYQQYKDQHMLQGQQAMMDTMGQAAALTGGYGNSYAQTAGQQAYQGHLQDLNNLVPELYQMALNKYQSEGQELLDQYGMYAAREEQDYGRYQDELSDYYTELDRLTDDAQYQSETDYGRYMDAYKKAYGEHMDSVEAWQDQMDRADANYWDSYNRDYKLYTDARDLAYDKYLKDQEQERWQKEFDEAQRQYNHKNGISTSTGGSTGGNTTTENPATNPTPNPNPNPNPGYNNAGLSTEEIKKIQKTLGVKADGKWGPESQAAAKAMWGVTSATQAQAKNNSMKSAPTGNTVTYSDVANTAAELKKKGASKNDIYQYISSMVNSSNYKPTNSSKQDLAELRSGYVGTAR